MTPNPANIRKFNTPHPDLSGIRPGEKLHEVMITEDDARMTVELDDRHVIYPSNPGWTRDHLDRLGAVPTAKGFGCRSDRNAELLDHMNHDRLIGRKAA